MADMAWIGLFYLCLLLCTESGVAYGRCTAPSSADMQLFAVGLDWIPHRIRRNRNVESGTIVMAICKKYPEQLPRMYKCLDGVWKPNTPTCKISQRWTHTKPTMSVTQTTILNMEDTTTEAAKISTEAAPSETEPLCPVIEKPFYNGEIVYMDERRLHSVAKFMCNEEEAELLPEALREMECLDNKQWSLTENEIPSCYKWAFVPKVQNGDLYHVAQFRSTLMNEELKVPHEHEVVLKCRPGWEAFRESEKEYLDVEPDRISSNNNGTWEPPIADCVPARCHLQKFKSTYDIKYWDGTSVDRKIHHDDIVRVTCANSSYEFQTREPLVIEKCSYGVITLPPCVPKSCTAPDRTTYPRLVFSSNNPSWFSHGVEATAVCTDATEYEVYNNDTKTFTASYLSRCSFGSWRPVYGCVEKHCDLAASDGVLYLDSFTHETILPGRYIISGESVIYSCTEDYDLMALPNLERHKTATNTCYRGVWTRNLTCEPKNCLPPDIRTYYGVVFSSSSTYTQSFNHGTMAKAVCTNATEYEIYNDDTKTFTENYQSTCSFGIWKPMYGCVEKHCDLAASDGVLYLDSFTNKSILPERDIISGESVLYSCSEGYNLMEHPIPERLKTVTKTTCYRGVWSRNLTCEPKGCMAPDSNTYYGVVLSSPSSNTGYFSHSTMENAVCNSTDYEIYNADTKTYTNSFLSTCSFGFWKPMYGCVEKHCDLTASNGVLYQESSSHRNISQWRGLASGESVLFSCAEGYDLMSHGNLERQKVVVNTCYRGEWSKNLTCEPKSCILLDTNMPPGVVFSSPPSNNGSFKHGITATVTCTNEDEYEIQDLNKTDEFKPSYTSTCSYGSWSHEYRCVEKRCMLRNEPNILYNVNDTYVISTSNVTVSCRSGYKLYDKNGKMFLDIDQGAISCTKGRLTPDMTCLKGCVLPTGYTINDDESGGYMINDDESGEDNSMVLIVDVGEVVISCGYEEINVTCDANGKIQEDLDDCDFAAKKCPKLHHGSVTLFDKDTYFLRCDDGYRLSISECSITGCADQKFKCGSPTCEPASCSLKAREGLLSNNEFEERGAIELAHNSNVIVGCDEGKEPAAVMYSCSFGKISGNNTKYPTELGNFLPQCKTASCNRCIHGTCIRDNRCRCNGGYEGHYCDQVICPCAKFGGMCPVPDVCECPAEKTGSKCDIPICDPFCLNNGGECNSQGQCICPTGRVGDTCQILNRNEYRIDVQIADVWFGGTYERVWIEVNGVSGAFKQELVDDVDRFNILSRNKKLRYKFSQIHVGEIKNVFIKHKYGIDKLNIKYITIHSFKDDTFYRFDSETFSSGHRLMRRMCTFTTHPRRVMAWRPTYRLGIAEHASECQLRCMGENDCGLAVLDKRSPRSPSCLGYEQGAKVYGREVQNTDIYERKNCTVSIF